MESFPYIMITLIGVLGLVHILKAVFKPLRMNVPEPAPSPLPLENSETAAAQLEPSLHREQHLELSLYRELVAALGIRGFVLSNPDDIETATLHLQNEQTLNVAAARDLILSYTFNTARGGSGTDREFRPTLRYIADGSYSGPGLVSAASRLMGPITVEDNRFVTPLNESAIARPGFNAGPFPFPEPTPPPALVEPSKVPAPPRVQRMFGTGHVRLDLD